MHFWWIFTSEISWLICLSVIEWKKKGFLQLTQSRKQKMDNSCALFRYHKPLFMLVLRLQFKQKTKKKHEDQLSQFEARSTQEK